jgi:hypothetical protein
MGIGKEEIRKRKEGSGNWKDTRRRGRKKGTKINGSFPAAEDSGVKASV